MFAPQSITTSLLASTPLMHVDIIFTSCMLTEPLISSHVPASTIQYKHLKAAAAAWNLFHSKTSSRVDCWSTSMAMGGQLMIVFLLWCFNTSTGKWKEVSSLESWFDDYDLCVLHSRRNDTDSVMADCERQVAKNGKIIKPLRCRVGNSWPSKSGDCQNVRSHGCQVILAIDCYATAIQPTSMLGEE